MSVTQLVILSLSVIFGLYFMIKLIYEMIWFKRLNQFKLKQNVNITKFPKAQMIKNGYLSMLSVFVIFAVFMAVNPKTIVANKEYVDAKPLSSSQQLAALIDSNVVFNGAPEFLENDATDGASGDERSYTDTNIQVEGVDEADVIKTDGYQIYYAPSYGNELHVYDVDHAGVIALDKTIDLDDFYVSGMFLTDEQVIVLGYQYSYNPYMFDGLYEGWAYESESATLKIFDRKDMSLIYELATDAWLYDYRLIDNMLYMFSTKYLYQQQEEYRPYFKITQAGQEATTYLEYNHIYYFDDQHTSSLAVITSVNLDDLTFHAQGFLSNIGLMYATTSSFYITSYYYDIDYDNETYQSYTRILKFRKDEEQVLKYVANAKIEGYINSQYWMDEYQSYFRIVTTEWSGINRLYIFKENDEIDQLDVVSKIDQGIGKEGETVRSVRFNQDLVQIVTFEQTDPLYTIDLSEPEAPVIQDNPIEEEGFSTYLHVWHEDHYLVGFGFDADENGRVTGLKLSAYDTNYANPLDTYYFNEDTDMVTYNWSEAIYNPRALLINVDKGLFAFPVSSYGYQLIDESGDEPYYDYTYEALYYVFKIDFSQAEIIGDPLIISHAQTQVYNYIDRGVEIEDKIYTFSRYQVIVYDLNEEQITQTLNR